jgi:hypothetical protein
MIFLALYGVLLLMAAATLGIGPDEARIVFENPFYSMLYELYPNELFVRLPTIVLTLCNVVLIYKLAKIYLKKREDALLSAFIFALLPAVIGSAVVINKAPFILFLSLLFIFVYHKMPPLAYVFAAILLFVDHAFATLFLATAFYAYYKKKKEWIYFLGLFIASISFFGFDVGGKPKNYFLDTFAIFAAIFSPLLFLYFFYTIYRILVKEKKDLIWFISATAFLFSLFLSFRQRIALIDFAPFAVLGVILMVRTYKHSLRVRLKKYQKRLKIAFYVVMATMLLNDAALLLHKGLFWLWPSKNHFAYQFYVGKALADALKKRGVPCIEAKSKLKHQLRFYGVGECEEYKLLTKPMPNALTIEITFGNRKVSQFYVSKSNAKN